MKTSKDEMFWTGVGFLLLAIAWPILVPYQMGYNDGLKKAMPFRSMLGSK